MSPRLRRTPKEFFSTRLYLARDENLRDPHGHRSLGKADGTACGGHLLEARVWPTLEVVLTESPTHLRRKLDEETGLALIDLSAGENR